MSQRPINDKKIRRLRKAMRRSLPRYIDLVQWLMDRGYAQTRGEARRIILAKRVVSESHPLGVRVMPKMGAEGKVEDVEVVDPYVPASVRPTLRVLSA